MSRADRSTALVPATFVARPNRFVVDARLRDGARVEAHLADPGRLKELLLPEAELRLREADRSAQRRTRYTVTQVRTVGAAPVWVSLEPTRANGLAETALADGAVRGVERGRRVRREVRHGASRFDFCLEGGDREPLWIEVKAVTFCDGGIGRFPDAPTARGARHVRELTTLARDGGHAMILFVGLREDLRCVVPYREIDPEFADALRDAKRSGVLLRAARYRISPRGDAGRLGPVPVRVGR